MQHINWNVADTPLACPRSYNPVCGCDGTTHPNLCIAHSRNISVLHEGPCKIRSKFCWYFCDESLMTLQRTSGNLQRKWSLCRWNFLLFPSWTMLWKRWDIISWYKSLVLIQDDVLHSLNSAPWTTIQYVDAMELLSPTDVQLQLKESTLHTSVSAWKEKKTRFNCTTPLPLPLSLVHVFLNKS